MDRPSENTLIRYFRGQCLPHEIELIELYLSMDVDHEYIAASMKTAWSKDQDNAHLHISDAEVQDFSKRFYALQAKLDQLPTLQSQDHVRRLTPGFPLWMKVAAAVLILTGTILLGYNYSHQTKNSQLAQHREEILPGSNKAMLTLANGKTITLSDAKTGVVINVNKLSYSDGTALQDVNGATETLTPKEQRSKTVQNEGLTVTTPRGGTYQVTLPDGTKAWLNAASTLSYSRKFGKEERKVKMTGEIYFEVAKVIRSDGKRLPFLVETDKHQVQVLGTHFNVKAYKDEPDVKTTLLEGSVKIVSRNGQSVLLRPGQLAVLTEKIEVIPADIGQELAWKNGDFIFKGETLENTLRQVSRWYDVEIECPEKLGSLRFNGMISRKQPIATIIDMIQLTKMAKVTIKGRRLIVTD